MRVFVFFIDCLSCSVFFAGSGLHGNRA